MNNVRIHDLPATKALDRDAMTKVRGGWFAGSFGVQTETQTTSQSTTTANSTDLMKGCCTGKHFPSATITV